MKIIVTRHGGLVEWLARHGIAGEVIPHVSDSAQVRGRHVIGALPLYLAAEAASVTVIDLPLLTPEQRGKDLTPEEMDAAGAALKSYVVQTVQMEPGD